MSATTNRFAMLNLDDSDEESMKEVIAEQPPVSVPLPIMTSGRDHLRTWNLKDGRPSEVRDWNVDTGTHRHRRGGLFSRYAFKDDMKPKVVGDRPPRQYAFREDSPPPESLKPVTPNAPATPPYYGTPPPPPALPEEFPALSDYQRPQTPPYPPDDGWYPSLAERVKIAMEKQEIQDKSAAAAERRVINMDSVIPISTVLAKNIVIQ